MNSFEREFYSMISQVNDDELLRQFKNWCKKIDLAYADRNDSWRSEESRKKLQIDYLETKILLYQQFIKIIKRVAQKQTVA